MPAAVSLTTFAGTSPPWSLALLDANFSNVAALLASVNNYSTYLVDTGAADAYVVTLGAGTTCTLTAGLAIDFLATTDNTGASTLNVNGTGIVAITNWDGSALTAGQIKNGQVVRVVYDGTQYKLSGQFLGGNVPGAVKMTSTLALGGGPLSTPNSNTSHLQVLGTNYATGSISEGMFSADSVGFSVDVYKSRGATVGSNATIVTGDTIYRCSAWGYDSTNYKEAGRIQFLSTGTIAPGAVPGLCRIFTADSGGTLRLGLAIDEAQAVTIPGHKAGTTTRQAGDCYLVVDASGNIHVSAVGPAS